MRFKTIFILALAILAVSFTPIFARLAYRTQVAPLSFSICTLLATLFIFSFLTLLFERKRISKIPKSQWKKIALLGVLGTGLAMNFRYIGLKFTTAINAAFIGRLQTPFTTIFAYFLLKEKISKKQLEAMGLMFLGGYFLILKGKILVPNLGDSLVLLAALLWGYTNTYFKKELVESSLVLALFGRFLIGTILVLIPGLLWLGERLSEGFLLVPHFVFLQAASYSTYILGLYYGIKHLGASLTTTLILISPLVTSIASYFVLGEQFVPVQILGGVLVLGGNYLIIKEQRE